MSNFEYDERPQRAESRGNNFSNTNSHQQLTDVQYYSENRNSNQGAIRKRYPPRNNTLNSDYFSNYNSVDFNYQQYNSGEGSSEHVKKKFPQRKNQRYGYKDGTYNNEFYTEGSESNQSERKYDQRYDDRRFGFDNRQVGFERAERKYENEYRPNSASSSTSYSRYNGKYDNSRNSYYRNDSNMWRNNSFENKSFNKDKRSYGNWRNKDRRPEKPKQLSSNNKNNEAIGQRDRLMNMITSHKLECLVCCEKIRNIDKIWSCVQCYHIIHLNCIIAWAKSSKVEENWRCPACQNVYTELPSQYKCYCGKATNPKADSTIIAHGCGDMCLKKGKNCEHKCNILCHPGPCPECSTMVSKPCGCGRTHQVVKCSTEIEIVCDDNCDKVLNCGVHKCQEKCHMGVCSPCSEFIIQECYCGKTGRKVPCTKEESGKVNFICENECQKVLPCLNHKCQKQCHPGNCGPCDKDKDQIKSCFCGKTPLAVPRQSCLDPIPSCSKSCGKRLYCGPVGRPHTCEVKCHEGKCPPCPLTTTIRCRCGYMDKDIPCRQLTSRADDVRCEKKCTKRRLCGKHKCNQKCCIEIEHVCPLPCNHLLSCGLHRCERTCHSGRCPPCLETSFEELYCECGASVLYPPVPCGTKPPNCKKPCSKPRLCGHPPNHECHPGPCPPCFVFTKSWCFGKHEQRGTIPCNQHSFSCGLPCGKPLPCGRHKCDKPCHDGECSVPCSQPCTVPRQLCGHSCNKPCHDPPCPESACKQMVPLTCSCGLQKGSKVCMDVTDEFRNIEMVQVRDKLGALSVNQSVDISDLLKKPKGSSVLKILECNDECRILERNRRLAIGLQIQNPDLNQKLTPRYSDFLKQWAKKDPKFCQRIHEKLTELVQLAKQSKQKSRSFSFESMNRDKRHFIHEYCEHFGVESEAFDKEPNRNVVATAIKDKSWLPSMSLLEIIQRENGHRKVPGPVLGYSSPATHSESVPLKVSVRAQKPLASKLVKSLSDDDPYF